MDFNDVKTMTIPQLLKSEDMKSHFVFIYCTARQETEAQGQAFYEREISFLKAKANDDKTIRTVTTQSVFLSLLDLAYHSLSIEPVPKAQAYMYVQPAKVGGTREAPIYEPRLVYKISAYGELTLRVRGGSIRHADNPVLVYKGDYFEKIDGVIHHTAKKQSQEITDAYIKITREDGTIDYKDFSMADILSYKAKSKAPKSTPWTGGVNGQPTRGMIEAKVIKHAFSTYPRLVVGGRNTKLETDDDATIAADAAYATVMSKMGAPEEKEKEVAPVVQQSEVDDDWGGGNEDMVEPPYPDDGWNTPVTPPSPREKKKEETPTGDVPDYGF